MRLNNYNETIMTERRALIFKLITLIGSNQTNYFENATACS